MIKNIEIIRYNNGILEKTNDNITEESKINIFVNGSHYISLLCSNSELKELCTGFLFSEGVISNFKDIKNIEISCNNNIFITLDESVTFSPEKQRIIVSGCSKGSIEETLMEQNHLYFSDSDPKYKISDILDYMKDLNSHSEIFKKTGGTHCCVLCHKNDKIISEDIGRHNALDKIIGKSLIFDFKPSESVLLLTGRVSSEILLKSAKFGIRIIISRSAPTDFSVETALKINMTLAGFARGSKMNIYSGAHRLINI